MNTKYIDMPHRIKGLTVCDDQGNYIIILNSRLTQEQQKETYAHELFHIENGDFESGLDCDKVEAYY